MQLRLHGSNAAEKKGSTYTNGPHDAPDRAQLRDTVDCSIFWGEWCIGRIYENRSGPADLRWF